MKTRIFLGTAIAILIGNFLIAKFEDFAQDSTQISQNGRTTVTIDWQESPKSIAEKLKTKQIVSSKWLYYWYLKKNNLGENIKAGTFVIERGLTFEEITNIITGQSLAETAITVPEGYTISQIDQKLSDLGLIEKGQFLECVQRCNYETPSFILLEKSEKNLEGYLFPDTYFINPETFSNQELIERMLTNFENRIKPLFIEKNQTDPAEIKQTIIMASILEKEIRTTDDLPAVSGILWKRLANNWLLGADATLLYITNKNTITAEDLELDSPYNTRKNPGLPPNPIGNPGLKTIQAALSPVESPYWYYLTTVEGEVIYATTNEEHNENKRKYLK